MDVCMIVPCRDEESRLAIGRITQYLEESLGRYILFVDDGSQDKTSAILEEICGNCHGRARWKRLESNMGKASAVRTGMILALEWREFDCIGYMDADLSTPLKEIDRFMTVFGNHPKKMMLMGSRLHPDAVNIKEHGIAGFGSRIFSRIVSFYMGQRFYDTQCGFKIFKKQVVRECFDAPFRSRWIFDVEVLARMLSAGIYSDRSCPILEIPLKCWEGRRGSRISLWNKCISALYLPYLLITLKK